MPSTLLVVSAERAKMVLAALAVVALLAALALPASAPASADPLEEGDIASVELTLLGANPLASPGHDGLIKPRGQNGDVAVIGHTAFVAGGALFHGTRSTPGRVCTDYGGVKVVDVSEPANPTLVTTIDVEDTKGVLTGPVGNPRRGQFLENVASSVSAVDTLRFPDGRDVLAFTTQRCEQSFFNGARIEFWDVSSPSTPSRIGVFDPETITNPTPGGSPATGAWGIFEEVKMFTRLVEGQTRVYALATTPFSIGNAHDASFAGDMRVLDVTDPANPVQVSTFPSGTISLGERSDNGCRTFQSGRGVTPTPDGNGALLSWYDGSVAVSRPDPGRSAAVFRLDLDNMPEITTTGSTPTFNPVPPSWGYSFNPLVEGNAGDVESFTGPEGEVLALVSEEDVDPAVTTFSTAAPGFTGYEGRACELMFTAKTYQLPDQELVAPLAYVGRACPGSTIVGSRERAADPLLADPTGKIAVVEGGGNGFDGCSAGEKNHRLSAAGAVGVIHNIGGNFLNVHIPGPEGGVPAVPVLSVQQDGFNSFVGRVPNRVLTGVAFPATWTRSTSTNVSVAPLSLAITGATATAPIQITTSVAHGLQTGDRVAVDEVLGLPASAGTWTVTGVSGTQFTLDGSDGTGQGPYVAGGWATVCAPGGGPCGPAPTRTDVSRFRSTANGTDRSASVALAAGQRFAVQEGQQLVAGATLEVQQHVAGAFRAAVVWYGIDGNPLAENGESEIVSLAAVTPRTRFEQPVTAPAGAATAGMKAEWVGAEAEGVAFADALTAVPAAMTGTFKDEQGEFGAQRIIDFSSGTPTEIGTYRSPGALQWPPPDGGREFGLYFPQHAAMVGDLAFTTWMSDGLRAVDLSDPTAPREVGSYVPPDVDDPSNEAGAGPTHRVGQSGSLQRRESWPDRALVNGVDVLEAGEDEGVVVVSDVNGGLYVVGYQISRVPDTTPPPALDGFTVTGGLRRASLSWTAPGDPEVTRLVVRMTEGTAGATSPSDGTAVYDESGGSIGTSATQAGLEPGRTYTFTAFTIDEAGNRSDVARTVRGTTLTAAAAPETVVGSKAATISGTLRRGSARLGGQTVVLQGKERARDGGFRRLRSATTDDSGGVTFTVRPREHWRYRLQFAGGDGLLGGQSQTQAVSYRPALRAQLARDKIRRGGSTELRGSISPYYEGRKLFLQKWDGREWRNVDDAVLGTPSGRPALSDFAFPLSPAARRDHAYRAFFPGREDVHRAAASPRRVLTVE